MKLIIILAAVFAGLAIVTTSASGPKVATIALDQTEPVSGSATFTVTQANYKNPYLLWVANKCYADEGLVSAQYLPVQWDEDAITGTTAAFAVTGDNCTAYVWEYPSSEDPERVHGADVQITFEVAE